jgi:hypothetical protein
MHLTSIFEGFNGKSALLVSHKQKANMFYFLPSICEKIKLIDLKPMMLPKACAKIKA